MHAMTITNELKPLTGRILQDITRNSRSPLHHLAPCCGRQVTGVRYLRGLGIQILLEPPQLPDEPPALVIPVHLIRGVGVYSNFVRLTLSRHRHLKLLTSDPVNRTLYYPEEPAHVQD